MAQYSWWHPDISMYRVICHGGRASSRHPRRLVDSRGCRPYPCPRLRGNHVAHMDICHTIFFCGIFLAAIYGINRAFPRQSTIWETEAVVEHKYTKTRHHRQRVSRRVYKQGAPYKVYYIGLELPDGRRKDMQVTASRYNRIRSGSTIPLTLQKGFFGMTIILKNTSKKNTTL